MRTLLLSAFLFLAPSIAADDLPPPVGVKTVIAQPVKMVGPDSVDIGKSAIIKVPLSEAGKDYSWQILPEDVNWTSGENRNETFAILLDLEKDAFASFTSFDGKQHAVKLIRVNGTIPPGPDPSPNPPAPVPLPDGKYKLAAQSRDWVALVAPEHRGKAKDLANSFRGMAAAIAAGTVKKAEDILAQTKASNNAALGSSVDAWKPFGAKLQAALEEIDGKGNLIPPDDYKTAFNEIATGLEAAVTKAPQLRK